MTRIWLIRHAEAEGNLYRIVQGQHESALTDRGWRQVHALEQRFREIPVDAVWSSDLYRARATAMAVCKPKKLVMHTDENLREIFVGDWEGRTWGEIKWREPEAMEAFSRHMDRWQVSGAETAAHALRRIYDAVRRIASQYNGKSVAIVSHGYVIRLLLARVQGLSLSETGETLHGDNTAVSLLEYDSGELRLIFRDDNSHLRTAEYLSGETPVQRQNALEPGLRYTGPEEPFYTELSMEALRAAETAEALRAANAPEASNAVEALNAANIPETANAVHPETRDITYHIPSDGGKIRLAWMGEAPAGLLHCGPEPGYIAGLYLRPAFRGRGLGMQMLGQAVLDARRGGVFHLISHAPQECVFFRRYGFSVMDILPDGNAVWEKNIAFPPLS